MITLPRLLVVGTGDVHAYTDETWEDVKDDPRGLLLMWERPRKDGRYVVGFDPTFGITGWSRATRTPNDHTTDNAAIEVFEIDGSREALFTTQDGKKVPDIDPATGRQKYLYRDVQVAEYAAPVDAVESARVANVLGRIYAGTEGDQALMIHEVWPGPGMLSVQEMIRLGYGNFWTREYIDGPVEDKGRPGWMSTRESQKLLWFRARRHYMNRQAVIRSRFLLDELSNAEIDIEKMRARASYGWHDDRMQAANMAFWAGHKWTYNAERTEVKVVASKEQDYQRYAPTLDDHMSFQDWKDMQLADWEE